MRNRETDKEREIAERGFNLELRNSGTEGIQDGKKV
jgi:hypothetical protein